MVRSSKLADVVADVRWFFGQTCRWIWGADLLSAAHLSAIKSIRVYGLRLGRVAFYFTVIGKPEL